MRVERLTEAQNYSRALSEAGGKRRRDEQMMELNLANGMEVRMTEMMKDSRKG